MLDWDRIRELRHEIGDDGFSEVAEVFLDELEDVIGQLRDGGTPDETRERLHFLKGCALNLGFSGLAQLASNRHGMARGGQPCELDLPAMLAAYAASRDEFVQRIGAEAAA